MLKKESKKLHKITNLFIACIVTLNILSIVGQAYADNNYIDVTGRTIAEIAERSEMTLAEFLSKYELPPDMPGDTSESEAFYMIPVSITAEIYGVDFATMKESLEWGDEITETTTWGEAEGSTKVGVYIGEANFDKFKEYYGLGDDVTADTLWKDIRNIVDQQTRDERLEIEKFINEYHCSVNSDVNIYMDNIDVTFIAHPIIVNDSTLVPIRFVAEKLGFNVVWDSEKSGVTLSHGNVVYTMFKDGDVAYDAFGNQYRLAAPMRVINGKSMVPLRFLSEQIGINVNWDGETKTVFLNSQETYNKILENRQDNSDIDNVKYINAENLNFTLFNYSDIDIYEVYLSGFTSNTTGRPNLLDDHYIPAGDWFEFSFTGEVDTSVMTLTIVDYWGNKMRFNDIDFSGISNIMFYVGDDGDYWVDWY